MKLYVVRHGQTLWNDENRVCGMTDIDLTERGVEQAKELSNQLVGKQIDVIFSSPLSRAIKTAEIISNVIGQTVNIDHRLIEQNYGVFEGVDRNSKQFLDAKRHFPHRLSGGESLLQLAQRVFNLLDEIKEKYSNLNVLLVTHGGVCRMMNAYFNDQSNDEFYKLHISNCECKEYQFNYN